AVRLEVVERRAGRADELERVLAAPAEEAAVRELQKILVPRQAVDRAAVRLHARVERVGLVARELREPRADVTLVDVVEHPIDLGDVLVLRDAVRLVLEAELHVRVATALVAEHLETAAVPLADRALH